MKLVKGDLMTCNDNLVHCVSRDFNMGAGIAVQFKQLFGQVNELKDQNTAVGEVAILALDNRTIFYLVTKEHYWGKPTYKTLQNSLDSLKTYCDEHHIKSLSMPKIGCGLDKLSWPKVKGMITDTLSDINVTVYSL